MLSKIRLLSGLARPPVRKQFTTSAVRKSGDHHHGAGIPGSNLPFDISNRYKLTLYFMLFFGSGFSLPFLMASYATENTSGPSVVCSGNIFAYLVVIIGLALTCTEKNQAGAKQETKKG